MRGVAVLGSTGSIGRSTLAVLRRQREHFRVVALTAGSNASLLEAQRSEWNPDFAGLVGPGDAAAPGGGPGVLIEAATHPAVDIVVNAGVGAAGLVFATAGLGAKDERPGGGEVPPAGPGAV